MAASPERFATLLTKAIHQIKRIESKPIAVIQDELGYDLGREGGSIVEYWRKGKLPTGRRDIEGLAQQLVKRGHLERDWLEAFLASADYGLSAKALCDRLFNGQPLADGAVALPNAEPRRAAPFLAPLLTPHFIGREQEEQQIAHLLLTTPESPLVALLGMGGIGKTTLAIQLAHALRHHFVDGVLWADATTDNPMPVMQAWGQALGYDLSLSPDLQSRTLALRGILAERKVLIILDDVRSPEAVRPLLPGVTAGAVLLTTRDQDNAQALNARPYLLEELSEQASLKLLTKIIGHERVAAEIEAAQAICRLAHYLPLALEICAKQLTRVSWERLATLEQRLLKETARLDRLALKDLNVRAAFEISWQALTPAQRQIFTLLGLFAGRSFTVAALAHIAQCPEQAATEHLITFVTLSLVKSTAPGVFRQHPLLANFAESHLENATLAGQRFAEYYLIFCQAQRQNHRQLEDEFENIMHAMQIGFGQQQWQAVIDYTDALAEPWVRFARYREGRQGLEWGYTAAKTLEKLSRSIDYLIRWGQLCAEQNDQEEARRHLEEALQLAAGTGGHPQVAEAQYHLARLALEQGHYEEVDERLTNAHTLYQAVGDELGVASILQLRGILLHRIEQYDTSNALLQEALTIQEDKQHISGMLATLRTLTDNALMQFHHEQAEQYCLRRRQLADEYNDHSELAKCNLTLVTLCRRLARYDEALAYAEKALTQFKEMGNRIFMAEALYEKSLIHKLVGAYPNSLEAGKRSLAILQELQHDYDQIFCLHHLGDLYSHLGEPAKAHQVWTEALDLAKALYHPLTTVLEERLNQLRFIDIV